MANTVPERTRAGYLKEAAWGGSECATTDIPVLLPIEPPDIKEELEHVLDNNIRGLMARDYEGYPGMRKVTGTLTGPVYLVSQSTGDADDMNASAVHAVSHLGEILKVFCGGAETNAILTANAELYAHNFYATDDPSSWNVQVQDDITGLDDTGSNTQRFLGVMFPKLTLTFNATEGLASWSTDLLGIRQIHPDLNATPAGDSTKARSIMAVDKSAKATLGYESHLRVFDQTDGTIISGWDSAKLLSAEITIEREMEIKVGAMGINYANIRAVRAPTITFKAVVEFQQYADLQMYSNDTTVTFYDKPYGWHFRLLSRAPAHTDPGMPSTSGTNAYSPTRLVVNEKAIETNLDEYDGILDVVVHFVDVGEGPLTIDRSAVANTLEFNGRGIHLSGRRVLTYTSSPRFLGMAAEAGYNSTLPTATAQAGQRVFQVRLINGRTVAY